MLNWQVFSFEQQNFFARTLTVRDLAAQNFFKLESNTVKLPEFLPLGALLNYWASGKHIILVLETASRVDSIETCSKEARSAWTLHRLLNAF